jgi:hypothetical protein
MFSPPLVKTVFEHFRAVCPECFTILQECPCGRPGDSKKTFWNLCEMCMKREHDAAKDAELIPEGTLLDARQVYRKIMPVLNFPKEFIPVRLHPGYDQWKEKLVRDIFSSTAPKPKGAHDERSVDTGNKAADRGGESGASPQAPSEHQRE